MSAETLGAAATVRAILTGDSRPEGATIHGLRTPLGDSITAEVYSQPPTSTAHGNGRLDYADMERADNDADLALVIEPSQEPGINSGDAEAWNVRMTLPTLLRILGAETPTEGTPA